MIDQSKRSTLKTVSVAAAVAATGSMANSAIGAVLKTPTKPAFFAGNPELARELGNIEVSTRVSAMHNELEVVLTNAGEQSVSVTHMTPATARVARGEFDFNALLKDGPLQLKAGQSVAVPLQRKAVQLASAPVPGLKDVLRKSMSVVTDGNAFARVSMVS